MNEWSLALPPLLNVPAADLTDPARGTRYEWFEPDGEGGWAAGTAVWANTRREHGLLVVARMDVGDRFVLLSRIEETVVTADGERHELGCNFYPGAVHPLGHQLLAGFSLDPWPVWRYRLGSIDVVRELFRSRRAGALLLRYRIESGSASIELRPLFAGRTNDSLATASDLTVLRAEASEGIVAYRPYEDAPAAVLTHVDGSWQAAPMWYYRTVYPRETEANRPDQEDLFSPGILTLPLRAGAPATLSCGLRPARVGRVDRRLNDELARREALAARGRAYGTDDPPLAELAARLNLAADAFLPRAGTAIPVPTAFPDGGVHTRDALIALPWIARTTGRTEECMGLLRIMGGRQQQGLLPVRLGEGATAASDCAAVDTPLWYVEAVGVFAALGYDVSVLKPAAFAILENYEQGTSFNIHIDDAGLLRHGPAAAPMTWMDGVAHGRAVVERDGAAVDVNALWHNALLRGIELLPGDERALRWGALADRCREAFDAFWWQDAGWLADSLDDGCDQVRTLRPNQLLAVSLTHPIVAGERARRIVEAVERQLLVPGGVRTLAPGAPGYSGRADTAPARRHLGSAWTAWLGPFARAYLRVHGGDRSARRRIRDLLLQAQSDIGSGVLGQVVERRAGDPPHQHQGNTASAWALAGLLEALLALSEATHGAD